MTLPALFATAVAALVVVDGDTVKDPATSQRLREREADLRCG